MKFTTIFPLLAASASIAGAKSLLAVFPEQVTQGETYNVEWLTDSDETLELKLVHKESYGWKPVRDLFQHAEGHPPGGNYSWTVDDKIPTGEGYGLWLSGSYIKNPDRGYADLTKWFEIVAPESKQELKM